VNGIWTGAALIVLGWLLGYFSELYKHHQAREDRRASRQREALIDLQESLHVVISHAVKGYIADRIATQRAGSLHLLRTLPSAEDSQREFEARGRCAMLRVRIEDEEIGRLVDDALATAVKFLTVDSVEKGSALIKELSERDTVFNQRVGVLLKRTY
jgi:hypothetical protein